MAYLLSTEGNLVFLYYRKEPVLFLCDSTGDFLLGINNSFWVIFPSPYETTDKNRHNL